MPYASFHALLAFVNMLLCLFLCMDSWMSSFTSLDVDLFSYVLGDIVKVALSCPIRNSEAIGPSIPWWSMVNGSIRVRFVTNSCANCSDVELEDGWSFILNFLYSWVWWCFCMMLAVSENVVFVLLAL